MKRPAFVALLIATSCAPTPEDFPMEIRCAEQAYDSAGSMENHVSRAIFIADAIVWLRKSAGVAPNGVSVPDRAAKEMLRLREIARPPEAPLQCTLSTAEQEIAFKTSQALMGASDGQDLTASEMLDALSKNGS